MYLHSCVFKQCTEEKPLIAGGNFVRIGSTRTFHYVRYHLINCRSIYIKDTVSVCGLIVALRKRIVSRRNTGLTSYTCVRFRVDRWQLCFAFTFTRWNGCRAAVRSMYDSVREEPQDDPHCQVLRESESKDQTQIQICVEWQSAKVVGANVKPGLPYNLGTYLVVKLFTTAYKPRMPRIVITAAIYCKHHWSMLLQYRACNESTFFRKILSRLFRSVLLSPNFDIKCNKRPAAIWSREIRSKILKFRTRNIPRSRWW